jgi:hypothetical protein
MKYIHSDYTQISIFLVLVFVALVLSPLLRSGYMLSSRESIQNAMADSQYLSLNDLADIPSNKAQIFCFDSDLEHVKQFHTQVMPIVYEKLYLKSTLNQFANSGVKNILYMEDIGKASRIRMLLLQKGITNIYILIPDSIKNRDIEKLRYSFQPDSSNQPEDE